MLEMRPICQGIPGLPEECNGHGGDEDEDAKSKVRFQQQKII